MEISFIESTQKRQKPAQTELGFGKYFADYMFEMDYVPGTGWVNAAIKPYGPLLMEPSALVLHYGQSVFEGLKAYLGADNQILLFRPDRNIKRLNKSCERLCIPQMDEELVLRALKELVKANKDWIPTEEDCSLYIRPFVFAIDESVGVRASNSYKFMIIASPVGAYYSEGFKPVKIYVEEEYVRAVKGGVGEAKAAANYAASIKAQVKAKEKGYSQVLWLDGLERRYIEEVGTMNVFFKIKDEVLTPALNGSILEGVTRSSVIELIKEMGYKVTERTLSIDEVLSAHKKGDLHEIFGTGTAAVISPVGEIAYKDTIFKMGDGGVGELSLKLYEKLTRIQWGKAEDPGNWVVRVEG